ncbi:hypothetical protein ACGFK1_09520 [Mycobacterium sp. NPDC048908]|uniref:baeRF10 domain-containing protein n=1 Tax=Mycobacterium sp. NPDC048908 TaxID=3364292 RepID=UPI003720BC87
MSRLRTSGPGKSAAARQGNSTPRCANNVPPAGDTAHCGSWTRSAHVRSEVAEKLGWERILVSGGERWTEPVISRFPQALRDNTIADARFLSAVDDAALSAAITEQLHKQHQDREKRLLAQVGEAASSGLAALGLSEVAAALNVGRVAHLVYDPNVRYMGSLGADGGLYGGEEIPPAASSRDPNPG